MLGKAGENKERAAVFLAVDEKVCGECGEGIERGEIFLPGEEGVLCLGCAEIGHLEFLGRGDAALTRRACKHSGAAYVVLKFSRSRKRWERQGVLVKGEAIDRAEEECAADAGLRAVRAEQNRERAAAVDQAFVGKFAAAIRERYPGAPAGRERAIAEHACLKGSGRVGRIAAAKMLEERAIDLAVAAHVRHVETDYDRVLWETGDRGLARELVGEKVREVVGRWRGEGHIAE